MLYLADFASGQVTFWSTPATAPSAPVALSPAFMGSGPQGECVDSSGDVFISSGDLSGGNSFIREYKHGVSAGPFHTLSDVGYYPEGCAISPLTGNLAVANLRGFPGGGNVAVYPKVGANFGSPTYFHCSGCTQNWKQFGYLTYTPNGNLFVDGFLPNGQPQFGVLGPHAPFIKPITLSGPAAQIAFPGNIQFYGTGLVIGDRQTPTVLYRVNQFNYSSSPGIVLPNTSIAAEFNIYAGIVYVPDYGNAKFEAFTYPSPGAAPIWTLSGFSQPAGAVISP